MQILEIVDGHATLTDREPLSLDEIRDFIGGPVEGASLDATPDARSLVLYCHAEGRERHELGENIRLANGRTLYGPVLLAGIGPSGENRGLTPDELDRIDLEPTPRSPLPTLVYRTV